jgi:hypothetical protein
MRNEEKLLKRRKFSQGAHESRREMKNNETKMKICFTSFSHSTQHVDAVC